MKNKSLILVLLLLQILSAQLSAQELVKDRDKTIPITISHFIANEPSNKDFSNKAIVLEFWATWCAPCVEVIPRLNRLEDKFKDNPNIVFLSVTGEQTAKVKEFLKHTKMNAIVANDEKMKTVRDYGLMVNGAFSIPRTILIDNKGIIQFVGMPSDLNEKKLTDFLKKCNFSSSNSSRKVFNLPINVGEVLKKDLIIQKANRIFKDSSIFDFFELSEDKVLGSKNQNQVIGSTDIGQFCGSHCPLNTLLGKFINPNVQKIIFPDSLNDKKFNLIYKNKDSVKSHVDVEEILKKIAFILNLNFKKEQRMELCQVLTFSGNEKIVNLEGKPFHTNEIGTNEIFIRSDLNTVISIVENSLNINIINETHLPSKQYNFLINVKSVKDFSRSFDDYGINTKKENRSLILFTFY